ncbi:MAG: sugar transferase [Clostridia bacterium]|nr:MAG: sugar transferase [Clostridia bacterium]
MPTFFQQPGELLQALHLDALPAQGARGCGPPVRSGPPPPHEVEQYGPEERRRLSIKPGITCIWQVAGRNRVSFEDWVRMDLEYIDNWSLGLDLKLVWRTCLAVLGRTGW